LIAAPTGLYIERIATVTTATDGLARRGSARALTLILLIAVAFAPAVSRAHLRVSAKPTPGQENARFRWSNSCERVPPRAAAQHRVPAIVLPFAIVADQSPRRVVRPADSVPRVVTPDRAPPGLRAPPSIAL
jgi:hypothetical protein